MAAIIGYGICRIDGKNYKLMNRSQINQSANDRFATKITTGDYTLDSNDLLSADVMGNYSGGTGVSDRREGSQDDRTHVSTIYTRHPNKLSKPFRITRNVLGGGAGNVTQLGDMYDTGAWHYYFDLNGTLYKNAVSVGAIGGLPVNRSEVFQGTGALPYLYIPMGASGYTTHEPVGNTRVNTAGMLIVAFLNFGSKLIAVDVDGQLYSAVTAAAVTTFTSYGSTGKLNEGFNAKNLLSYWDRSGEKAIYIVTDSGLYVFDPGTPQLYEVPEINGVHPRFGEGSCTGNGLLYISAGLDVIEFNGSVGRNVGLSRDDGMPTTHVGLNPYIVDLVSTMNSMYAMTVGDAVSGGGFYIVAVHEYSYANNSWHMIETRTNLLGGINMAASRSQSLYRLFWGAASGTHNSQSLPFGLTNPVVVPSTSFGYEAGTGVSAFMGSWTLTTPYFDGGLPGYMKVGNSLQIDWDAVADHTLLIEYRTDTTLVFTELKTFTSADGGIKVIPMGGLDANSVSRGVPFRRIQFQITINDTANNVSTSPIIKSLVFSYLKKMNPSWSWSVKLDLSAPFEDRSPDQMFDELVALKDSTRFYAFQFLESESGTTDQLFTASIAAMSDLSSSGTDNRKSVQLSVVEVRPQLGSTVSGEVVAAS